MGNETNQEKRLITGLTEEKEGDISLGDSMQASTRIGKMRANQEDGVLLIVHPENREFKMLVVADGMGGEEYGEMASSMLIEGLAEWFTSLDASYYDSVEMVRNGLQDKIEEISNGINRRSRWAGTTYCSAIVGRNKTLMSNVGDSRAFIVKNGHLEEISYEDSEVQEMYEDERIWDKGAKRFHKMSNAITQCVGTEKAPKIHSTIMSNDTYDTIVLTSDGVTDCLSDEDIIAICKTTKPKDLAKKLVQRATEHESHMSKELEEKLFPKWMVEDGIDEEERGWYNFVIPAGKDNTSSATYTKEER